ncbi:MAG: hypothetical protein ABJE66_30465 [Deltaproteobacteria bacterium]
MMAAACSNTAKESDLKVSAVNDLVPAQYKYKLDFVARSVNAGPEEKQLWTVPAPKSWRVDSSGGGIYAQSEAAGKSYIQVWTKPCSGQCKPELPSDRADLVDEREQDVEVNGKPLHRHIEISAPHPIVPDDGLYISVYTWAPGGTIYHKCTARLAPEIRDAQKAFEAACTLATPLS